MHLPLHINLESVVNLLHPLIKDHLKLQDPHLPTVLLDPHQLIVYQITEHTHQTVLRPQDQVLAELLCHQNHQ